jgi:5'(3')-deoxyribonucleotidase
VSVLNIWVDCDGVMADFVGLYLSILNYHTGRDHVHEHVTCFDFASCVASTDEDERVWRHIDAHPGLVRGLEFIAGAKEALDELRKLGTVRCLTSPHLGPTWMPERARWLQAAGFTKKQIVFCSDKALVPGDVFIEDNKDTCEAWQAAHPGGLAILFDAPHNQGPTTCIRALGWASVLGVLRGHTGYDAMAVIP